MSAYPDGYLGTIRSRRDDRLLDSLKNRENQRAYQRGVHKGERIDQSDYFWAEDIQPEMGIARQAAGAIEVQFNGSVITHVERHVPSGRVAKVLVNDGKVAPPPRGSEGLRDLDEHRAGSLMHLRPTWR
jgi:hypothetical protein